MSEINVRCVDRRTAAAPKERASGHRRTLPNDVKPILQEVASPDEPA